MQEASAIEQRPNIAPLQQPDRQDERALAQAAGQQESSGEDGGLTTKPDAVQTFRSDELTFTGKPAEVVAVPGTPDPQTGQRLWEVTVQLPSGVRVEAETRFTGQLGEDQLAPDTPLYTELTKKLEAGAAQADKQFWEDVVGSLKPHFWVFGLRERVREGQGEQILIANDLSGFYFESKGRAGFSIAGLPVNVVEAASFNALTEIDGKATSREFGLGVTKEITKGPFAGLRISVNSRGLDLSELGSIPGSGDSNPALRLGEPLNAAALHGASATVTVEATPRVLERLAARVQGKSVKMRAAAMVLENAGKIGSANGLATGLAYQGKLLWNPETEQLVLKFGELETGIPVHDLFSQTQALAEELTPVNHGSWEVAGANAIEALLLGSNPYEYAVNSRADGESRNHGLFTLDIANRILEIGEFIKPHPQTPGEPIRTNRQAEAVLERALAWDQNPHVPAEYLELVPSARDEARESLTPYQSARLQETLAMLHVNGIATLFGDEVAAAASEAAAVRGDEVPFDESEQAFVKDVFEGQFRRPEPDAPFGRVADLLVNLSGALSVFTGTVNAGAVADDAERQRRLAAQEGGLMTRLETFDGGILEALSIDPGVAGTEEHRGTLRGIALGHLREVLMEHRDGIPNAESLYADFTTLSDAQRAAIGEQAIARFERAIEPIPEPLDNGGDPVSAMEWNFLAYRRGENPFDLALYTRVDGQFRNHGDPVSHIAGHVHGVAQSIVANPETSDFRVRTNSDVTTTLERAIALYQSSGVPAQYRTFVPDAPDASQPQLTDAQRVHLEETLVLLHEYGIASLYGEKVARFAAELSQRDVVDVPVQNHHTEFVQEVFEGYYRQQHIH